MCGIYYCILCTSNLDLVSFLFVPIHFEIFTCLLTFVLSNMMVEGCAYVHKMLCTQTICYVMYTKYYYSNVLCCGMYEEHCLPTNCVTM